MKSNVKVIATLVTCIAATAVFPIGVNRIAESTQIGGFHGIEGAPLMRMEYASALRVPDFELNCEKDTFARAGWTERLGTSIDIVYWSLKARGDERDFLRYDGLRQNKAAATAAARGVERWSHVAYGKKVLECYEVAALVRGGAKAVEPMDASLRDAQAAAAAAAAIGDSAAVDPAQEAANAAAAAADSAAGAADR